MQAAREAPCTRAYLQGKRRRNKRNASKQQADKVLENLLAKRPQAKSQNRGIAGYRDRNGTARPASARISQGRWRNRPPSALMTELPLYLAVCAQNATPTYNGPDCEKRRRPVAGRRRAPQDALAPRPVRRRPIRKPNLVKLAALALASVCAIGLLAGCSSSSGGAPATNNGEHATITMNAPYRNMSKFQDLVHEKYPRNQPGGHPPQRRKHQRVHDRHAQIGPDDRHLLQHRVHAGPS